MPARATGHGRHRDISIRKSHIHLFDGVRHPFQEGAVHLEEFLQNIRAATGPAAPGPSLTLR